MEEDQERLLHSRSPGARKSALSPSDWRSFAFIGGSLSAGGIHRLWSAVAARRREAASQSIAQLTTAYTSSFRINSCSFAFIRGSLCRCSWRGGGFRHHADLLREGDEARVVLVGKQERIVQHFGRTRVVRGP